MNNIKKVIAVFALFFFASTGAALAQSSQDTTPQLKIITPSDGQTIYGDKIPVLFGVDNFQLTDFQKNPTAAPGQGHIHLWLDDTNQTPETAVKVIDDNYTYSNVTYGDHTLHAELVNNDHTPLNPPQATTVQFKSASVGSANPAIQSSFDKNTALVILVVVSLVIVAAWWYTKEDDEEEKQETPKGTGQAKNIKPKTKKKPAKKTKSRRKN